MGGAGRGSPRLLTVRVVCLLLFVFFKLYTHARTHTHTHTQLFGGGGSGKHSSVGPVGGAAIAGLAALGLLLHAARLTALTRTTLQEQHHSINHVQNRATSLQVYLIPYDVYPAEQTFPGTF